MTQNEVFLIIFILGVLFLTFRDSSSTNSTPQLVSLAKSVEAEINVLRARLENIEQYLERMSFNLLRLESELIKKEEKPTPTEPNT